MCCSSRFTRCRLLVGWLLVARLLTGLLSAEELARDYVVRTWTSRDGLPLDTVRALAQTPDGFLWVATFNGLARFDGSRFVPFQVNNTPELPDNLINALFCDRQGRLWIGHDTGQITVRTADGFSRVKLPENWSSQPIHCFGDDAQGNVWVLNSQWQMAGIRPDGGVFLLPKTEDVILNLNSSAADGVLRATALDGRCYRVRPDGFSPDPDQPPLPNPGKNLLRSRAGGYWTIHEQHLQRWIGAEREDDLGAVQWAYSIYVSMAEWRNWVVGGSFANGLFFAGSNGTSARLTAADGLPDNSITALLVDRDQTLWIGTRGGLAALWPKRAQVLGPPESPSAQRIQSVAPCGTNGIWVATEGSGLFRYDGQWTRVQLRSGRSQVLTAVWSSPDSGLWVGSGGGGLAHVAEDEWNNPPARLTETDLPDDAFVHCLLQTTPAELWVGTRNGLIEFDVNHRKSTRRTTAGDVINCLADDGENGVWFGTKGAGLGHWRAGNTRYLSVKEGLPGENIFALLRDDSGTLWIGTGGAGLVRYRAGELSQISSRNGLPDDAICQIIADEAGRLWLGTYAGICAVKLSDLNACADGGLARLDCLMLNEADGLTTSECSSAQQPACCRTQDGRLWFATRRGVAVVDPSHIAINSNPPQIWIEPIRSDSGVPLVPEASGNLELPLGQHRVEIRFAAPSLKAGNRVRFIHRLVPVEPDWSHPDNSHEVIYGALPAGDYAFHVRAANEDGVWSATDATIVFRIPPHLWERVWFAPVSWTGGALAVFGLGLLDLRRRARRKLELSERQRALERERARISKDLHDDLGGSLTEVGILAGAAAEGQTNPELRGYLDEINRKSEGMIFALDEIIWAINPRHDSVRSFADYLSGHAAEFLSRAGLRLRLDVQQDLPDMQFDSRRRHSCFLAAKEALTNVVRHAGATEVLLHLRIGEGRLRMAIEDNGTGLHPAAGSGGRHGLRNLHERLAEMGGHCRITRGATSGTRVELEVPL